MHDEHAWQRRISGADAYYGVVLAGTLVAVAVGTAGGGRVLALAALTAMAPWYAVAGRPVARGDPVPARVAWYLAGLAALLAAAQAGSPWSSFLLLALCPQAFVLLRPRWATGVTAVFSLTPVLLLAAHPGLALGAAGVAVGTVLFAATFGQASATARENLAEARGLIAAQPPAALAGSSLPEALHRLTGRLAEQTGIGAECAVTGTRRRGRRRGVIGGRRGGRRPRVRSRRRADGPADARRGRCPGHQPCPGGTAAVPDRGADHLRQRSRHLAGGRGRGERLPAEGR